MAERDAADLSQLTAALLDAARKAGATEADAVAVAGESLSVDVRGGALEHADRAAAVEIGLRVGQRPQRADHRRDGRTRRGHGARGAGR